MVQKIFAVSACRRQLSGRLIVVVIAGKTEKVYKKNLGKKCFFFHFTLCQMQTWAVFSKASGIAAASRFSGCFSGIENGTVGVASGTGKTGNSKNRNGLQLVLKSISRGGANGTRDDEEGQHGSKYHLSCSRKHFCWNIVVWRLWG